MTRKPRTTTHPTSGSRSLAQETLHSVQGGASRPASRAAVSDASITFSIQVPALSTWAGVLLILAQFCLASKY
ncbi:hypothetical protein NLG97_g6020 [Lecanicillium saksenae]|uniref:Uncharacterized protein n=1 Tax=Lecanicillium saksenae TaxID=468837 RepID=A0ACC1QSP1_9HYPO|nr:hypothetical protein NLG97_g6020 [Lecanicillium saksenae]